MEDVAVEYMHLWKRAEFERASVFAKQMAAKVIEVMTEGHPAEARDEGRQIPRHRSGGISKYGGPGPGQGQ